MKDNKQQHEFASLVLASLQGDISREQELRMAQILKDDPEAISLYAELMEIYVELSPIGSVHIPKDEKSMLSGSELPGNKDCDFSVLPERDTQYTQYSEQNVATRNRLFTGKYIKLLVSVAALFICVLLPTYMYVYKPVSVATVIDSINAQFKSRIVKNGDRLSTGFGYFTLASGVIEIRFDSGARAILEAPAEFKLKSNNSMDLRHGRLFAYLPDSANSFSVETENATFVDLGTEFGLDVKPTGVADLYVYSGEIDLNANGNKQYSVASGQAKSVDSNGKVVDIDFECDLFIRHIDSVANIVSMKSWTAVSIADLILGGNGYGNSEKMSMTFSIASGKEIATREGQYRTVTSSFRSVPNNPYIDGIFVPNGSNQTVSSDGMIFQDCPYTSGVFFYDLCIDKNCEFSPEIERQYRQKRIPDFPLGYFFIHSNLGMTIDLNAVRNRFTEFEMRRLKFSAGNIFSFGGVPILEADIHSPANTDFDVLVVVDGQLRSRIDNILWDKLVDFDISVKPGERFVSILVTDGRMIRGGDTANHYDSCALADLRVEMELK